MAKKHSAKQLAHFARMRAASTKKRRMGISNEHVFGGPGFNAQRMNQLVVTAEVDDFWRMADDLDIDGVLHRLRQAPWYADHGASTNPLADPLLRLDARLDAVVEERDEPKGGTLAGLRILRYTIPEIGKTGKTFELDINAEASLLTLGEDLNPPHDAIIWVLVDTAIPVETRRFRLAADGERVDDLAEGHWDHIGSYQSRSGYTWHVFELFEETP